MSPYGHKRARSPFQTVYLGDQNTGGGLGTVFGARGTPEQYIDTVYRVIHFLSVFSGDTMEAVLGSSISSGQHSPGVISFANDFH